MNIQKLVLKREARGGDLHALTEAMPLDLWRRRLGPADFRVLERVQNAFWTAEYAASEQAKAAADFYAARGREAPHPDINVLAFMRRAEPEKSAGWAEAATYGEAIEELRSDSAYLRAEVWLEQTNLDLNDARVEFANLARARSSGEYTRVVKREQRRSLIRHPWRGGRAALHRWRSRRRSGIRRRPLNKGI